MTKILEQGFNPGGIASEIDTRDHQWHEIGAALAPFDWNKGFDIEQVLGISIKPKDQNGSGSCGGQAWSYYGATLEGIATGTYEERSAKFIYSQTFVPGGGSAGRTNCDVAIKQGWARETVLSSYNNGNPPDEAFMERSSDITDAVRADAKLSKGLSYANVKPSIDLFAQATASNNGMIMLIKGANNGTWLSENPVPSNEEWSHWLYIGKAKLVNGKKKIAAINSWGSNVGNKGWQWFGEEWFNHITEGWTMIFNTSNPQFVHTFAKAMKMNETSDEVKALQQALRIDGEFTYPTNTGFYGDVTRKAVHGFQVKYKIPDDNTNGTIVGQKTMAQLNKLFSK